MVIGSSWVQLERVNPRHFPTYSARERVNGLRRRLCLKAATRCSRETKLIRGPQINKKTRNLKPTILTDKISHSETNEINEIPFRHSKLQKTPKVTFLTT
ncbi:hypothetical protein H5410_042143 [Solanum commersonii]|uniref:Uncharacterized protein n=1 Tax=Solanum commersonii TaxID=4109 RepID=A0A9J5XUW7_SOLCO|nr:hypothetical protein H5410_042143 [Solanum commersonii]